MRVGLHGFLCCGNIGDGAMAEAIVRRLIAMGHSVTAFAFGDSEGDAARLTAAGARVVPAAARYEAQLVDAFVIGGGELGPGFGWQLSVPAMVAGARVVSLGEAHEHAGRAIPLQVAYYRRCALVAPRDSASMEELTCAGYTGAVRGADPALDTPVERVPRTDTAAVFVRHPNRHHPRAELEAVAQSCIEGVRRAGLEPVMHHCTDEDNKWWGHLARTKSVLRDPMDAARAVAGARLAIAVGRYHPAVFALLTSTPCVGWGHKLARSARDLGTVTLLDAAGARGAISDALAMAPVDSSSELAHLARMWGRLGSALSR